MKRFICAILIIFTVSATTFADSADKDRSISILAIGNSFSVDAMQYLYDVLDKAGYEEIHLGNLYIGGCPLTRHADNLDGDKAAYAYYTNDDGTWVKHPDFKASDALTSRKWDYISMQQASGVSGQRESYEPWLTTVISYAKRLCPGATLMWHMTWAYDVDSSHKEFPKYNRDQMHMYRSIVDCVRTQVLPHSEISFVIPSGTTVQNLRTSLLSYGMTRDGYHMSYDFGRYATALTWARKITGCDIRSIVRQAAPVEYVYTDAQLEAMCDAVEKACDHPYEVTASCRPAVADYSYVAIDGDHGKLSGLVRRPLGVKGKVPAVILMHGFNSSINTVLLKGIADALVERGVAVFMFDFNGQGKSEGRFRDMTMPNELVDAHRIYDYVRAQPWVGTISLGGHSQGGVISGMLAGELGARRIHSLLLLAPAAVLRDDGLRGYMFWVKYDPVNVPDSLVIYDGKRVMGREYLETSKHFPIYETSCRYTGPVYIMHGMDDMSVPYTYGLRYHEQYRNSRLELLPGLDHKFNPERQKTVDLAVDFLVK